MSVLTMNLNQLYQRRGLWLAYLMFALLVWFSLMVALDEPRAGKGTFIGLIVLAFLVGMMAAVLQMEILTKPMALCLPQHRRTVGRFILTVHDLPPEQIEAAAARIHCQAEVHPLPLEDIYRVVVA